MNTIAEGSLATTMIERILPKLRRYDLRAWGFPVQTEGIFASADHPASAFDPPAALGRRGCQSGGHVLRFTIAAVLFVGAALKTHQLVAGTTPFSSQSRWLQLAVVEFEFSLAAWLISNVRPQGVRIVAALFFGSATCLNLFRAMRGDVSCGCFGKLRVSPWATSALDLGLVLGLWRWHPSLAPQSAHSPLRSRARRLVMLVPVLGLLLAPFPILKQRLGRLATAADVITDSDFVVLQPESWVGSTLPLADYVRWASEPPMLNLGNWYVVLHHKNCPICNAVIPKMIDRAHRQQIPLVLIEVPSLTGRPSAEPANDFNELVRGQLSPRKQWFARTPVILEIRNGIVASVSGQTPAISEGS